MKRSPLSSLFVFSSLIALILFDLHGVTPGTLEDYCKKIEGPNLTYDFCMEFLQRSGYSKTAVDLKQLAEFAIPIAMDSMGQTRRFIITLWDDLGKKWEEKTLEFLHSCTDLYDNGSPRAYDAIESLRANNTLEAYVIMNEVFDVPRICEDLFRQWWRQSPMTEANAKCRQDIRLPLHIVQMALTGNK
ncbi:hypothetical protein FRX31_032209 [Thalictrum thalictroides]|uniref:Pectinesterase inhibitor domain-containing protein n=1 Tax=Thalictrum thalictroides TaxID=46969 RepID=A0A7J6UZW2_THATH|nr:hypothetical protein FRX31_032209 [Thalictrum thalictroides]